MYLALDAETGGQDTDCSLLTAYFAVLDEKYNTVEGLYLTLKPDNGEPYKIRPAALKVNGIDLVKHDSHATPYSEAAPYLQSFIRKHASILKGKLEPIGHNVEFDLGFIYEYLLPKSMWEQSVSYRITDTQQIGNYLKKKGVLPPKLPTSLASLAEHYGLSTLGHHEAKFDVELCIKVLQKMLA